jgi:glycosyltransferase involved in cell wall biosynthesis
MKILFDHQIFTFQNYGGISRYFYELMKNLTEVEFDISILFSNNHYLKSNDLISHRNFFPNTQFPGKHRIINKINKIFSIRQILKNNFDIFHPTYYDPYFLKYLKKPFVITVHDMIHEKYPSIFPKKDKTSENKKELIRRSDQIIAVSNQTKEDIVKLTGVNENKIKVIYHGCNSVNSSAKELFHSPKNYILYVGSRKFYKNFNAFVRAFGKLHKIAPDIQLVCTGEPLDNSEKYLFRTLNIESNVKQFNVNDEELSVLYKNAKMLAFPSLYEGFGLPILEAMSYKCPIALSNTSCFPEIAGDAGEYFDPSDDSSIEMALKTVLLNEDRKNELLIKAEERIKLFSWEKTARQTIELYSTLRSTT